MGFEVAQLEFLWNSLCYRTLQKYTEELYRKDLYDPDNHDGVITNLEPDILECEVKWDLESITTNKAGGGDGSKVRRCKEQYRIGTWNVRAMNQGKLEVVKQQMASVNVNILGIGELKSTGMGEFNSDDHYIYYCGQESLRRNGVAIMVNKIIRSAVLGCNLKNDKMISIHFQVKSFTIMVIQVYAPTSNAEEAEVEQLYEDL